MIALLSRRAALASLLPIAAQAQTGRPLVVASFTILMDMVARIAGDGVRVASLVPRDGDPHAFQARPGDVAGLHGAAAMVQNGLGLEGWLGRMAQASGFKGRIIVATDGITPRSLEEAGATVPDPHVWQDPALGQRMVQTIADGLAQVDPPRAAQYRQGAADYLAALKRVDADIERAIAPIPRQRRKVLTTHDAFAYYGARYGVEFIALEGISTDAETTPRSLAGVARQARAEKIGTVFLENMTDPRLARALAREAGLRVGPKLYSDALSPVDGPAATYLDLLRYNTAHLVEAMA